MCFLRTLEGEAIQEREREEVNREGRGSWGNKEQRREREINKECNVEGGETRGCRRGGAGDGKHETRARRPVDKALRPTEGFHWRLIER